MCSYLLYTPVTESHDPLSNPSRRLAGVLQRKQQQAQRHIPPRPFGLILFGSFRLKLPLILLQIYEEKGIKFLATAATVRESRSMNSTKQQQQQQPGRRDCSRSCSSNLRQTTCRLLYVMHTHPRLWNSALQLQRSTLANKTLQHEQQQAQQQCRSIADIKQQRCADHRHHITMIAMIVVSILTIIIMNKRRQQQPRLQEHIQSDDTGNSAGCDSLTLAPESGNVAGVTRDSHPQDTGFRLD